jgi:hypothetical protein
MPMGLKTALAWFFYWQANISAIEAALGKLPPSAAAWVLKRVMAGYRSSYHEQRYPAGDPSAM